MNRKRFKSAATSRRFKSIGSRLEASRGEIEAQTRRNVDAIALSKQQAKEASNLQIGGLSDNARFEEGVLQEHHKLEQKVRTRQLEAITLNAQRDVEGLNRIAAEKEKWANFLTTHSPKAARMFGELAESGVELEDTLRGMREWDAAEKSGQLKWHHDGVVNLNYNIARNVINDTYTLDPVSANASVDKTFRFSSLWAQNKLVRHVKENKQYYATDARENWRKARGIEGVDAYDYNEENAVTAMDLSARALLRQFGVSESSRAGTEIINMFKSWGALDQHGMYQARKHDDYNLRMEDLKEQYLSAGTLRERNVIFNAMVIAHKNGYHKIDGKIVSPEEAFYTLADSGIGVMNYIIENDKTLTNEAQIRERFEGYLTPGSTDKWTTDMHIDQRAEVNKDAEYWLDKHAKKFEDEVLVGFRKTMKANHNKEKDKLESDGIVFNLPDSPFSTKLKQYEESEGGITIEESYELLNMVTEAPISEAQKKIAFEKLDYRPTDFNKVGNLRNFMRAMNDGDLEQALKIWDKTKAGSLSEREKTYLEQQVLFFKNIEEHEKGGIVGWFGKHKQAWTQKEKVLGPGGYKKLGDSGKYNMRTYTSNVFERYQDLLWTTQPDGTKIRNDAVKAWTEANRIEGELKAKGVHIQYNSEIKGYEAALTGQKYDPNNNYNWIQYDKESGFLVYPNTDDRAKEVITNTSKLITERVGKNEDAIEDFLRENPSIPLKPESIKIAIENGWYTPDQILDHPAFLDNQYMADVIRITKENASIKDPYQKPEPIPSHPNLDVVLSGIAKNQTKTEILNARIKTFMPERYKNGLRIPMDETDCLRLQTDKNAGKKSTAAVSAYNACMAQGIWPKSFNVEGVLEGLDPVGTYQKMEGINWERDPTGKTVVSDPEKFFKSGGLNYMTSDEIKELFPAFFGYENIGSYRVP